MMGFCANGNDVLSFMKKRELLGEGCNKFFKRCTGMCVSEKYAGTHGQVLATGVRKIHS
jgi:hypothetical protein